MAGRIPNFKNLFNKLNEASGAAVPGLAGVGAIAGGGVLLSNSLYDVEAGNRAIKFNRIWGIGDEIIEEGTHFRIPWFERPIIFDIKTRPRKIRTNTGTKDLQMVDISIRTLVRPDTSKLTQIYRMLGMEYEEKVLPSIVNEVLKSVVAQYNASQLIKDRVEVSRIISNRLTKRAKEFNIILEDVALTDTEFGSEYSRAVEAKQVAQQQAEKAKYVVLKALEEKKNIVTKAEGEAAAAKMIGTAMKNNPGFIELRRIEAAKEVAQAMAKSSNKILLSSDALMLNLIGDDDEVKANKNK